MLNCNTMLFQMGIQKANRERIVVGLLLFLLTAGLGLSLFNRREPWHDDLAQASYDSLHRIAGEAPLTNSPVVIVYLDLPSYQARGLDPLKPWPRALHAELVRRLSNEGARAVVFDIVFADKGQSPEGDAALASAIRENGKVVLAADLNFDTSHATSDEQMRVRKDSITPPADEFSRNAAAVGLAIQQTDDDYTLRRYLGGFSDSEPSLSWATANWLQLAVTKSSAALPQANRSWIRYYGLPLSIPHVSYREALDPDGVPKDFFRGKIVFIGARPWTEQFHERQDEFRSPYHTWSSLALFMPGVEVHATEMLNLLRGDLLSRLSGRNEIFCLALIALLFGFGLVWLRPIPATCVALVGAGAILTLSVFGFAHGTWFPWVLACGVEIPTALGGSALFNSIEWYRARRRFEAAKRIAEAKIHEQAALIEKAHDAILVQSVEGGILYANPSAERLYGWNIDELQRNGAMNELFLPDTDAVANARATVLRTGEWSGELHQQTRAGQIVVVASRWTLIRDTGGKPSALLMISSDVTEKKQLEAQFLRAQRMNTIGTLAGGMAHDLNNALAPILMGVQLLRRKDNDAEARNLLQLMETSTHRGADMVRQVLLFARGREGEFERLELQPLFGELEKMVRETFPKNIKVDSFLPKDLWPVHGNPTQVHQILLNLCVNARDAMPNGGQLSFAADNVELTAEEAGAIPEGRTGKFVSLLVSDTGTGMPPEVRARIFEPFYTTKSEGRGTGIGLSTVLRLVKAHHGFLRVESEPGQGTAFEIFLPRVTDSMKPAGSRSGAIVRGNGQTILIADDEQAIRQLLTAELSAAGYRVLTAADGAEALALFSGHREIIKLFITDGAMPVLDGMSAIAALRKTDPSLPVILTSGEAEKLNDPHVTIVPKPFSLDDILASIQQNIAE
jgi:PAS domain S-box-containing protein